MHFDPRKRDLDLLSLLPLIYGIGLLMHFFMTTLIYASPPASVPPRPEVSTNTTYTPQSSLVFSQRRSSHSNARTEHAPQISRIPDPEDEEQVCIFHACNARCDVCLSRKELGADFFFFHICGREREGEGEPHSASLVRGGEAWVFLTGDE